MQVTSFPLEIDSFKVQQDSATGELFLLFASAVYPQCHFSDSLNYEKQSKAENKYTSGVIFDSLMVRHWDTWGAYTKRNHVFICPLDITSDYLVKANVAKVWDLMKGLETGA